jgi:3'-5' exonuclease
MTFKTHYLVTEAEVNDALAHIKYGVIGFDTEFMPRTLGDDERFIENIFTTIPGSKRSAITAWQALQIRAQSPLNILWDNVGLCIIQIAEGDDVWVINLTRIRGAWKILSVEAISADHLLALPSELRRIITSKDIIKAGVGVAADVGVIWNDLGEDINYLVDCGLMARLLLAEKFCDTSFANLSLSQAVEEVLGLHIGKELQKSNWKGDSDGDITDEQKRCQYQSSALSTNILQSFFG